MSAVGSGVGPPLSRRYDIRLPSLDRRALALAAGLGEEEADLVLGEDGGEVVAGIIIGAGAAPVPRAAVAAVEATVLTVAAIGELAKSVSARLGRRRLVLGGAAAVAAIAPVLSRSPILSRAPVSYR